MFQHGSKNTSKPCLTGCEGNPPVTCGFPSQRPVTWKKFSFDYVIMWWPERCCLFLNCPNGNDSAYKQKLKAWLFSNCVILTFINPEFRSLNSTTSELYITVMKSCACDSCVVVNEDNCGLIHAVYHNSTKSVLFWNCQRRPNFCVGKQYVLYGK